jgi:hypothetical protein
MTMQTSGAISIGQARNECNQSGQINAGAVSLQKLAGVNGQLAWSEWYGKSSLPDINNQIVAQASCNVDRDNIVNINLRTGAFSLIEATGDHGPHLSRCNVFPPALIASYASWSCQVVFLSGSNRMNLSISQQPSPANDFTVGVHWDDNANSGNTDEAVSVLLTCTKP